MAKASLLNATPFEYEVAFSRNIGGVTSLEQQQLLQDGRSLAAAKRQQERIATCDTKRSFAEIVERHFREFPPLT